jgi:mannosyltransferase OCH1-like enzyme
MEIHTKQVIPLNIFQCWRTKHLPPGMQCAVDLVKQTNPEFKHFLYDDKECRDFIKNECHPNVLKAYDTLIPGAYKADLWRLCILYKKGGIYMDIKMTPLNNFKFIQLTNKEYLVKDIDSNYIFNAFMVCKPNNPFVFACINAILKNVHFKYYGKGVLDPTGPGMMGNVRNYGKYQLNIPMKLSGRQIIYNDKPILQTEYPTYRKEQNPATHYSVFWRNKKVYV